MELEHQERFILDMRGRGATRVRIGMLEVEWPSAPTPLLPEPPDPPAPPDPAMDEAEYKRIMFLSS
jgi:hypothetical protein